MKRTAGKLSALFLAAVLLLAGCSKGLESTHAADTMDGNSYETVTQQVAAEGGAVENGVFLPAETAVTRKIIQNAGLDMETDESLALYRKLTAWVQENGGYEASKNQYKSGEATVVEATLKLPPEQMNLFLEFAAQSGEVINSNLDSQDITDEYYDVKTRLESKRKGLQSYYGLLEKAENVDEIAAVQNYINQITEEIEALEGRMKLWDNQVNYASITVYIREYTDAVKIKKDIDWNTMTFDDMAYMMKQGFLGVVNTVLSGLQWVAIVLVAASPVLLPLLALLLCLLYLHKRKKQKAMRAAENREDKKE